MYHELKLHYKNHILPVILFMRCLASIESVNCELYYRSPQRKVCLSAFFCSPFVSSSLKDDWSSVSTCSRFLSAMFNKIERIVCSTASFMILFISMKAGHYWLGKTWELLFSSYKHSGLISHFSLNFVYSYSVLRFFFSFIWKLDVTFLRL